MFMRYVMEKHIVFNKHQCSSVTIYARCRRAELSQPSLVAENGRSQAKRLRRSSGVCALIYLPSKPLVIGTAGVLTGPDGVIITKGGQPRRTTLAAIAAFVVGAVTPGDAQASVAIVTPGAQVAGVEFTLTGTYAVAAPSGLDYSLDNGATWTPAAVPTISGGRFSFNLSVPAANPMQTVEVRSRVAPTVTATSAAFAVAAAANFTTSGGKFFAPDGNSFIAKGVNCAPYAGYYPASWAAVKLLFPKINFVRLVCEAAFSLDVNHPDATTNGVSYNSVIQFIAQATADKVVCMIDYHTLKTVATGGTLSTEYSFYNEFAAKYKDNPYIWFNSENEPDGNASDIVAEQKNVYRAVRDAGNNTIILMSLRGGGYVDWISGNENTWSQMTNVGFDLHYYGYLTADFGNGSPGDVGSTTRAYNAQIAAVQKSTIRSLDGVMPVAHCEFGPSTGGDAVDANGLQVVEAVLNGGLSFAAWSVNATSILGGDALVINGSATYQGDLTPYGQFVAARIAQP